MSEHVTKSATANQSVSEAQEQFEVAMAIEGFMPGTRKAYSRALEQFCGALKGKSPASKPNAAAKAIADGELSVLRAL